jgi:geranylgeranyl diphosphate synthase type I
MLATDDTRVIEAYRSFGWALGMAFQINDDLLGIWGDQEDTGKLASDLEEHKRTLPLLHALEHGTSVDRHRLLQVIGQATITADDAAEVRDIMERTGSRTFTRGRAAAWRDEALSQLQASGIVDGEAMVRLEAIVRSVISA